MRVGVKEPTAGAAAASSSATRAPHPAPAPVLEARRRASDSVSDDGDEDDGVTADEGDVVCVAMLEKARSCSAMFTICVGWDVSSWVDVAQTTVNPVLYG